MSNPSPPVFDLSGGSSGSNDIPLVFSTPAAGLQILWTFDGSDPTTGTVWGSGQVVPYNSWAYENASSTSAVVYVQAVMHDTVQDTYSGYVIQDFIFTCADPVVSQASVVTVSCSSPGAILYYYAGTSESFDALEGLAVQISNPSSLSLSSGAYVFFCTTSDGMVYNQNIDHVVVNLSGEMMIRKFNTSNASGIPTAGVWTNLSTLEPATVGSKRLVTIPSSARTGYALAERFVDKWDVVGADTTSISYITGNQIPAPAYNPFRSHIYLGPAAAELIAEEATTVISTAMMFSYITVQSLTWTRVRLWMANIDGTPVAPTGIWFALCDGGYADNPSVVGSWVSASSLVGPPAGTDDSPGIGPVCAYATLGGSSATQTIAVRIQMPAGTYTRMPYGIGTAAGTHIPEWSSFVYEQTSAISGTPGTTSGWGDAFGKIPHFWLEVDGLSQQQCLLGCVGDSHTRGYLAELGGSGYRGMFGEIMDLKGTSRVSLVNFGRAGHTTAQISSRLHAIETQMDLGGWLRQRASINDRDGSFDYTVGMADTAYAQLQSDYSFIHGLGKLLIPFQGFGMDGASGWYGRFNTHLSEELTAYPWSITTADSILDSVGFYDATMGGPDDAHPSILGYETAAVPTWTSLQASLVTLGVTL